MRRKAALTMLMATLLLIVTSCGHGRGDLENYFMRRGLDTSDNAPLQHCHGYGCRFVTDVTLSKKEWRQIGAYFKNKHPTVEEERKAIAKAIAKMEQIVGAKTGTHVDIAGTFRKTGLYQLDCVDESTNTSVYLKALYDRGWLKHYRPVAPEMRVPLIHAGSWPHQSAVMTGVDEDEIWAVDSWFHDNGAEPEIVPLGEWKDGWKPEIMIKPPRKPKKRNSSGNNHRD